MPWDGTATLYNIDHTQLFFLLYSALLTQEFHILPLFRDHPIHDLRDCTTSFLNERRWRLCPEKSSL